MSKQDYIKNIIANNPAVDEKQFKECRAVLKKLKKAGIKSAEYNLVAPFTHSNIQASKNSDEDTNRVQI